MQEIEKRGLAPAIKDAAQSGKPFLGICAGMQLLFEKSYEYGEHGGLGFVKGEVCPLEPDLKDKSLKVPQIGWNNVTLRRRHPLFDGIKDNSEFYFVHSYYPAPSDATYIVGETEYAGTRFAAAVGKGNLFATQFHPERSGRVGLKLLENFTKWDGTC